MVSGKAKELLSAFNAVQMNKLTNDEHTIWMEVIRDMVSDAEQIEKAKDVSHQRCHFIALYDTMHQLVKVSKREIPVYCQHCPKANDGKGANWLGKKYDREPILWFCNMLLR